ncbi:ATP-binding protein [Streptomyces sp. NPDC000229]|uniref:ATP-binding protein n=1 Tax=Streptomyces sp. NPDC000229 TaxID=3154247 RepID=UPI0033315BD4
MKQSAAKTLGVAALGAAFAAATAGTASAATTTPAGAALGTATATAVPVVQSAVEQSPNNATELLATTQELAGAVTKNASLQGLPIDPATVTGLLGGLPVGGTLPVAGLGG